MKTKTILRKVYVAIVSSPTFIHLFYRRLWTLSVFACAPTLGAYVSCMMATCWCTLDLNATPEQMGMEDEDTIDAMLTQVGGVM